MTNYVPHTAFLIGPCSNSSGLICAIAAIAAAEHLDSWRKSQLSGVLINEWFNEVNIT